MTAPDARSGGTASHGDGPVRGTQSGPDAERKPRVIFVDHVARLSGGEIALLRLLPPLLETIDAHIVLGEDGPLVKRLEARGIAVEVMPLAPRLRDIRKDTVRPSGLDPMALARLPAYVYRLSRRIRTFEADIVHTNSLKASLYGGAAARLAGVPMVWHLRDRITPDYLPRSAVTLVRLASRVLPATVVANSHATLETLPRGHRGMMYDPVVVPAIVETRSPKHVPHAGSELIVGVVGRLAPWKGQHVFLDAFAQAFRGTPTRGRIVGSALFGEDDYARSLEQQTLRLGIADQIEFRGFREDIFAELAEFNVFVHCSVITEPFGQVVLEAMAAGVPVIATDAGGPAELITNGVDGILTAPGNVEELAAALRRLRDDPALCSDLARAARTRSAEFTPERAAAQLMKIYREILAR